MRAALFVVLLAACGEEPAQEQEPTGHQRMLDLLEVVEQQTLDTNKWLGDKKARELRPQVAALKDEKVTRDNWWKIFQLGVAELWLGREAEAIEHLGRAQRLLPRMNLEPKWKHFVTFRLGVAYLRLAETQNCCALNTPESCIVPMHGGALHTKKEGSRGAIREFTKVANATPKGSELRLGSRWLLNLAYMTLGEYPDRVPADLRLPPSMFVSDEEFPRFQNIAKRVGLDDFTLSGGTIADDFDNDGDLDLMVSSWDTSVQTRYHRNNGDGTFTDRTKEAGLLGMLGGLNLIQADFNNDGLLDFLILRGAWMEDDGRHPNSLLKNLGGGRFIDVTFEAGLGAVHYPTQAAGWADYEVRGAPPRCRAKPLARSRSGAWRPACGRVRIPTRRRPSRRPGRRPGRRRGGVRARPGRAASPPGADRRQRSRRGCSLRAAAPPSCPPPTSSAAAS